MKLSTKIPIDMREFCRTGRFDCLEIGQTKELILSNFPDPDQTTANRTTTTSIWRYGNIELHFNASRLWMIFSDYIGELDGGPSLTVDPWFLCQPEKLTLIEVTRALHHERIDFTKKTGVFGEVKLVLTSGVALQFDGRNEDANEQRLAAFSLQ